MSVYNFLVCGPNFTSLSSSNRGGNVVDQVLFPIFDTSIRSGDIRDQNRKLSKTAPNFGHFLPS